MDKVHFETSASLGILTLANPPLNLLNSKGPPLGWLYEPETRSELA